METQVRALESALWLVVAVVSPMACGPDGPAGTSASTGEAASTEGVSSTEPSTGALPSTGVTATTSGGPPTTTHPSTGTTEALQPCSEVHEGDLFVSGSTDLASLANLGHVTGNLTISMGDREQPDLAFLPCLHTAEAGITIRYNLRLETTNGLVNLTEIGSLSIDQNPSLREIVGFEQIKTLGLLTLRSNHALEGIHLESLHTVKFLEIGWCEFEEPSAYHLALTSLEGFSGLTDVGTIVIDGNEALMSADLLDALALNGAPEPPVARIRFNPLLPEALVHEKLDALGVTKREVCGNMEGDPECYCLVGE